MEVCLPLENIYTFSNTISPKTENEPAKRLERVLLKQIICYIEYVAKYRFNDIKDIKQSVFLKQYIKEKKWKNTGKKKTLSCLLK